MSDPAREPATAGEPSLPNVNRRRTAVWSAVFGYLAIAVALVRNIVLVPLYLHYVPLDEFGAWMASGAALVQVFLIDFGLSGMLMQRVSLYLGAGDIAQVGVTVGSGLLSSVTLATVLVTLGLALSPLTPLFGSLSPAAAARVLRAFQLAIVTGGFGIVGAAVVGVLRSFHGTFAAGVATVVADLVSVAVTVAALYAGAGLYSLPLGLLSRALAAILLCGWSLRREIRRYRTLRLSVAGHEVRTLLRGLSYWFATSIAMKLQTQANTVVVAYALGPSAAARYGLTVRAHETIQQLISQLAHAVAPSMAHLYGSGRLDRFREVTHRLLPILGGLAAIGLAVTVCCDRAFVDRWVGPGVYDGDATSVLMAAAIWASTLGYVAYDSLQARGDFRQIAEVFVTTAVLHLVLLAALTPFGAFGAPAASLMSSLAWAIAFWSRVERGLPSTPAERRVLIETLARVALGAAVVTALGLALPGLLAGQWLAIVLRAALFTVVGGLLVAAAAPHFSRLLREEFAVTLRRRRAA